MRKYLVLIFMFLSFSQIFGQNVNAFFEEVGNKLLATLAHPTNTFKYAESKITDRGIWVDIYYEGYNTSLLVKKRGPLFTGIEVLRDNDFVPPFSAVEVIKNYLIEQSNSTEDQKVKSDFERVIEKTVYQMNGLELSCLILSMTWIDY